MQIAMPKVFKIKFYNIYFFAITNQFHKGKNMSKFIQEAKMFIMKAITEEQPALGQKIFWRRLLGPINQLPPPLKDAIPDAMKELQKDGIFDDDEGITEKGLLLIYGSHEKQIQEAKEALLQQFRSMQARPGYQPNWKVFMTTPQAFRDALSHAVKELQRDGLLDESGALTQKGYEFIY